MARAYAEMIQGTWGVMACALWLGAGACGAGQLTLVPQPRALVEKTGVSATDRVAYVEDATLPKEGYALDVSVDGAQVRYADAAGRYYADVTLRQLRGKDGRLPCCSIVDSPRYAWRGALVDVSRHFVSLAKMKEIVDWMAYFKLNVLHWHLTDSQGWRIESELYPALNKAGATRPRPDYCKWNVDYEVGATPVEFYTKAQIRELVRYAAERHVNIMPEIDFPGHSRAFNFAYPDLYCLGKRAFLHKIMWDDTHRHTEVVCLGNDTTVEMCENLVREAADLFPFGVIHLGGDECVTNTWGECAKCQARIRTENLKDEHELQTWFFHRLQKVAAEKGKRVMGWDEILKPGLSADAIVQNWHAPKGGERAAAAGHDVIQSPNRETYLDYDQGLPDDPSTYPGFAVGAYVKLETVFRFDPVRDMDEGNARRVMGAEACNWTNCTPTEDELMWKMWPRQAAFAEAVWTAAATRDYADFVRRLRPHWSLMRASGLNAAPVPAN